MMNSPDRKSLKRFRSSSPSSPRSSTFQISDLSNCIIQHILAFLPLIEAISFCTLSKQWLSLWKSMTNLSFHCESNELKDVIRFASFVDKALAFYASAKIKKFSLEIYYNRDLIKKIVSWLHFATSHNVEELCLDFTALDLDNELPQHGLCQILESMCLTSLKVLSLTKAKYRSATIRAILLQNPFIESLTLRECVLDDSSETNTIDATGTSLKELVIDGCRGCYYGEIKISAPNLLSLTVVGYFGQIVPSLLDVSSLKEATINIKREMNAVPAYHEKQMLKGLLEKLTHVDKLAIGIESLQVLSIMRLDGEIIPTSRCRTLKVEMKLLRSFLPIMGALMDNSPYLEHLILSVSPRARHRSTIYRNKQSVEENYWRSEARISSCLNKNLRRVEVVGFVPGLPRWSTNQILVETMHFLLDHAKLLQKLVVHVQRDNQNRLLEIEEKILSHPRASPNAQVEFVLP